MTEDDYLHFLLPNRKWAHRVSWKPVLFPPIPEILKLKIVVSQRCSFCDVIVMAGHASAEALSETYLSWFFSLVKNCCQEWSKRIYIQSNVCLMMWYSPFHLSYHLCSIRTTNHVPVLTNCVGFETGFVVKMLVFLIFAKSPVKLSNEHKHLQNCQCRQLCQHRQNRYQCKLSLKK